MVQFVFSCMPTQTGNTTLMGTAVGLAVGQATDTTARALEHVITLASGTVSDDAPKPSA